MLVRDIEKSDLPVVFEMMKDVYYEIVGEMPEIDFKKLYEDLFGEDKVAQAIVVEGPDSVVGFLFYEPKYFLYSQGSYLHISFIAVKRDYRRNNSAEAMVNYLLEKCKNTGYIGLCCDIHNVNYISRRFFKKNKFKEQKGTSVFQRNLKNE